MKVYIRHNRSGETFAADITDNVITDLSIPLHYSEVASDKLESIETDAIEPRPLDEYTIVEVE